MKNINNYLSVALKELPSGMASSTMGIVIGLLLLEGVPVVQACIVLFALWIFWTLLDIGFGLLQTEAKLSYKVGTRVLAKTNFLDEQLEEYVAYGVHVVTERRVDPFGRVLIKTDKYGDWVYSNWFEPL